MVHGRTAYMVACGPRTKGAKPGSVSVYGRPFTSAAVYSGFTTMPSGVCQASARGSPPGADLAAAFSQAASDSEFIGVSDMLASLAGPGAACRAGPTRS
jgi:hypothetical protein